MCEASEYLDKIAEADSLAPCVHGHPQCALVRGGECCDEKAMQCQCDDCCPGLNETAGGEEL